MFILRQIIPLVVISLLIGFLIARIDFSALEDQLASDADDSIEAEEALDQGWSVDAFVNGIRRQFGTVAVDPLLDKDVAAQLSVAAARAEARSGKDSYLTSILQETDDLAVTTVTSTREGGLTGNSPAGFAGAFVTVAEGESLSDIAGRVYGNPDEYLRIFAANRDVLSDPDQIYAGQRLRIPDL